MAYAVYITAEFARIFEKFTDSDKEIMNKIFLQLKENPYVGDPIRYRLFREKRIREKRLYYLVYDDLSAVLIIAFGGKKEQQETINKTLEHLPEFRKYVEYLLD